MSRNDKSSVQIRKSKNAFQFGDGVVYPSKSCAIIPIYVGSLKFKVNVDIVDCNIPLLLSKSTLQRANAKVDKGSATIVLLGVTIPLTFSLTGHMYLQVGRPLDPANEETKKVLSRLVLSSGSGVGYDVKSKARKLHLQFCHPPSNQFISLIQKIAIFDKVIFNVINEITVHCDLCQKNKEPLRRTCSRQRYCQGFERSANVNNQQQDVVESESESDDENNDDGDDTQYEDSNSSLDNDDDILHDWIYVNNNKNLPKVNMLIECKFPNYDPIVKCKVLSKAGKSSTPNWHFVNIQEDGEEQGKCCSFKDTFWRSIDNADGVVGED